MFTTIIFVIAGIGAVVALVGWALAHVRPVPAQVRDDLGPVVRSYAVPAAHLVQALRTTIGGLRGVQLAEDTGDVLTCNVRPRMSRLDDAMGLFVRIRIEATSTGSRYSVTGMAKSSIALSSSSESALVGFERDLRMAMKRATGVEADLLAGQG